MTNTPQPLSPQPPRPPAAKPEFPPYIDSSMLSAFRSCKKKFYWNYLRHLRHPGGNINLIAGSAIAAAIDTGRRYYYTAAVSTFSNDKMLLLSFQAFIKTWKDFNAPPNTSKTFENCWYAVEQYFLHHHPSSDHAQPLFNVDGEPTVEFSFAIPIPVQHPTTGSPILFTGRFDMLGKWNDLVTIFDEKTTTGLGPYWLQQWQLRGQFLGYCWACQQLGYPVRQAAIRGIGILKTEIKFMTALQQYPQYLIDRWYEELLLTVHEMIASWERDKFSYNFGEACASYGGCQYIDLCCASQPEDWTSNYEVRVWNPLLKEDT